MRQPFTLKDPIRTALFATFVSCMCLIAVGCASSGSSGSGTPTAPGVTSATLLITSTNNATIPIFKFNLLGLQLVAENGTVVPLLSAGQVIELGSISGAARPLVTVTIPQGTYSTAKLTYGPATFVVIDRSRGPDETDFGNYNTTTPNNEPATVSLALTNPLVVQGGAMGLLFDLDIPHSTTFTPFLQGTSTLAPNGGQTTFNPVFSLTSVTPAPHPETLEDGLVEDVHGQVTASAAGALTIKSNSGALLTFAASTSTLFSGLGAGAPPPVGSFVDVDAALQQDGSMLATRVQTEGSGLPYNLVGPVVYFTSQRLQQSSGQVFLENTGREQQGPDLPNGTGFNENSVQLSSPAQFEVAWTNGAAPAGLSFSPSVSTDNSIAGQNVSTPVPALQMTGNTFPVAPTVTLEPQTIDATVAAVSTANGETTYQVKLFADDLIALFGPSQRLVVHVTSETHVLTTSPLAIGAVARFRGLLFNDGGTLRLVAIEILDGVPGS